MPRGDKSKYTDKQERKADHIAESYESRGVPEKEAERRAWPPSTRTTAGQGARRLGPRQENRPSRRAPRGPNWRRGFLRKTRGQSIRDGQKGRRRPQAKRRAQPAQISWKG
jgi:plasmid stabilization system protein ParE